MVTPSPIPINNNPSGGLNTPQRGHKLLGEVLIELGLLNEEELQEALHEVKKTGQYLGAMLVRKGKVTKEELGKALSQQFNIEYVSLSTIELDRALLKLLPDEFIRDNQVIPIAKEKGKLVVAMVDPRNRRVYDEITFITGMRPQALVTTSFEFQETMTRLTQQGAVSVMDKLNEISHPGRPGSSLPGPAEDVENFSEKQSAQMLNRLVSNVQKETQENRDDLMRQQQQAELLDSSNPLVKLVNSIIEEGIEKGASDIHVEARDNSCYIRFRVDGILQSILEIPPNLQSSFMTRLKVMSRMDIAEHRRPQDGRFAMAYKGTDYNLRVNTLPLGEGKEKIVIRILRPSKNITDFSDLGITLPDIEKIERLYKSPYGIVLVCGPTGAGKTTTLYTILHKINDEIRNISTIEDPIELKINGLNQSQVNIKAEYTFASAMRALMRQDPDVIMVGEIRDCETLDSAIHASLTGHLVFSTIHANTSAATVTRLVEMGAESALIGSALLGVIAQRLARTLCETCKTPYAASEHEKSLIFPKHPEQQNKNITLYQSQGCKSCSSSGYSGRSGLYEIMMMDRRIRQLISESKLDMEIEDAAVAGGMKTLYRSGLELLLKGRTSFDELVRVLGPTLGRTV